MQIKGFLETSLIDWDGRIAAVLFLPGCNFRCPYCYNHVLARHPEKLEEVAWERIESYLVASEALPSYLTRGPKSERDLIKRITVTGQRMLKKKEITRIEALSGINFKNAIVLLTHENVLSEFTEDEGKRPVKYYAPGPVTNDFEDKIKRYLTRTGG